MQNYLIEYMLPAMSWFSIFATLPAAIIGALVGRRLDKYLWNMPFSLWEGNRLLLPCALVGLFVGIEPAIIAISVKEYLLSGPWGFYAIFILVAPLLSLIVWHSYYVQRKELINLIQ